MQTSIKVVRVNMEVLWELQGQFPAVKTVEIAAEVARKYLGSPDREYFIVIGLSIKSGVNYIETVSIGSLTATIVHPREIFTTAILGKAAGIICVHNHPSGNPEPSAEDIEVTERLVKAGKIIGIDVLDHIILGKDSYVSLRERGML